MRLGLIADIHGNKIALNTVLAELEAGGVDLIVCLGDLAVLGPWPNEVVSSIRERAIATVCGNTDAWLVQDHPIPAEPPNSPQTIELNAWSRRQLSESNMIFLRELPLTRMVGDRILCFHGSPRSVDDIISNSIGGGGEMSAPALAGGHTHIQELRRVGDAIYVNPGSVGLPGVGSGAPDLPVNRHVEWAEYAVLDMSDGRTEVSLRRVPLDVMRMWAYVQRSGMPHADWWRSCWAG
jgi:putative phosphoesterase